MVILQNFLEFFDVTAIFRRSKIKLVMLGFCVAAFDAIMSGNTIDFASKSIGVSSWGLVESFNAKGAQTNEIERLAAQGFRNDQRCYYYLMSNLSKSGAPPVRPPPQPPHSSPVLPCVLP